MFQEDELLPLSALQHLLFCERQCALIHIEQLWDENRLTVEGRHLHDRVHQQEGETRGDIRIARGLPLRSLRLGLVGIADVVEFHEGRPLPVEYKHGKPKADESDKVQLCAQALCLEDMMSLSVPTGAIFYGKTRRRLDVEFTPMLRSRTEQAAARLHELIRSGRTPIAAYEKKCDRCSLYHVCLPKTTGSRRRVQEFVAQQIESTI